jgi:hypothetical protein
MSLKKFLLATKMKLRGLQNYAVMMPTANKNKINPWRYRL